MKNKAYEYAVLVGNGTVIAPNQVRKACEVFIEQFDQLQHQDEYLYFWDEEAEQDVYDIISCLNFARGAKAGQPISENLAKWQWFLLLNLFCWKYKKYPDKRKIREVVVTVARKNSKSVLAVLTHIIAFILDIDNATHFLASNNSNQAQIVFDELTYIIQASPDLVYETENGNFEPIFNLKKTYIECAAKRGKLKTLSGESRKQDGIMPFVATIDELGASNEISKMVASIRTGQMGVRNPILFLISTSYGIENAHNYWKEVVDGATANTYSDQRNETKFGLVYLIDTPDKKVIIGTDDEGKPIEIERWEDKNTWFEANPLVAEVPNLYNDLIESFETTKDIPVDYHEFKIKQLNMWMQADSNDKHQFFTDLATLKKGIFEPAEDWNWWRGKDKVMIGLDLALTIDNTAAVFMWYDKPNDKYYTKTVVFYAGALEAKKSKVERVPYDVYRKKGWAVPLGDGDTTELEKLGPWIIDIVEKYDIKIGTVLYDRKYARDSLKFLNENLPMQMDPIVVEQNAHSLGPVISFLHDKVYRGQFHYAPSELLEAAYSNGMFEFNNGKPYIRKKDKDRNKIDTLFASFSAIKGIMTFQELNYYEENTNPFIGF